jgi:hypothetical protein
MSKATCDGAETMLKSKKTAFSGLIIEWLQYFLNRSSVWIMTTACGMSNRCLQIIVSNAHLEAPENRLFMGDADAGERGAIIYTVIESCRRRKINPYAYLKDVLTRLPKMTNHQVHEVTPQAWAKVHLQLQRQAS